MYACCSSFLTRVPLSPELKEVLEVAYVSRIMSKNFRKEGQPEKERIARITGMEFDKVAWFTCTVMHCCFSLVISILISFQLVFMMLTIFSSILVIVRERFLKIVLF